MTLQMHRTEVRIEFHILVDREPKKKSTLDGTFDLLSKGACSKFWNICTWTDVIGPLIYPTNPHSSKISRSVSVLLTTSTVRSLSMQFSWKHIPPAELAFSSRHVPSTIPRKTETEHHFPKMVTQIYILDKLNHKAIFPLHLRSISLWYFSEVEGRPPSWDQRLSRS